MMHSPLKGDTIEVGPSLQDGYTLTELLIAIAVITTLIGALALGAQQYRIRAYNATAQICAREIVTLQQQNQTDSQVFKALTANDLSTLRACDNVHISAGSNEQTLQTTTPSPDEPNTPGIIGAAADNRYAYLIRHGNGNRTYAATEGNTELYGENTTRDAAILSELTASRSLVASASGGGSGSGGGSFDPSSCAAYDGYLTYDPATQAVTFTPNSFFFSGAVITLNGHLAVYSSPSSPSTPTNYAAYYDVTGPNGPNIVGLSASNPDFTVHSHYQYLISQGNTLTPRPMTWSYAMISYQGGGSSLFNAPYGSCSTIYIG